MKLIQWSRSRKRAHGCGARVSCRLCSSPFVPSFELEVVTVRTGCWTAWGRGGAYSCCSVAQSSLTLELHELKHTTLVHHYLLELAQSHVYRVSDAIQPSHPLSSPSPPAFSLSHRIFSSGSALQIRWPKDWSFSISVNPSNENSGLMD